MVDSASNINQKSSIFLSRNHPVALVVGAAGFIGSHLTEKLLDLGVQVIGIDNLITSPKENLSEAFKHKNFHFLHLAIEDSQLESNLIDLSHLDYAIFIAENPTNSSLYKNGLPVFLKISNKFKQGTENSKTERPKIVFMSSIDVYDSAPMAELNYLKSAENQFAKFVKIHRLNGRVMRLSEVYGPRMHFRQPGPMSRLIKSKLEERLDQVDTTLDFSCRGLFVNDAVSLILRSILSGATSGKIYDGCLPQPVKVEEIKQILLDFQQQERNDLDSTVLPSWPTPNLDRSLKELSWLPKTDIATGLRTTINFFEQNKQAKEFALKQQQNFDKNKISGWSFTQTELSPEDTNVKKERKISWSFGPLILLILIFLIGLLYPLVSSFIGAYSFPSQIGKVKQALNEGDLSTSRRQFELAKISSDQMYTLHPLLLGLGNLGLEQNLRPLDNFLLAQNTQVVGIGQELDGWEKLAHFNPNSETNYQASFAQAQIAFSKAMALSPNEKLMFLSLIPSYSEPTQRENLDFFYHLAQQGEKFSRVLSWPSSNKNYLLILTKQGELSEIGEMDISSQGMVITNLQPVAQFDRQLKQKNILLSVNNLSSPAQISSLSTEEFPQFAQSLKAINQSITGKEWGGVIMMEEQVKDQLSANLIKQAGVFTQALDQKQAVLFGSESRNEAVLSNFDWAGSIQATEGNDGLNDFLTVINNSISSLDRGLNLTTTISEDGGVSHSLTINYQNLSSSNLPIKLEIFLPIGTKLILAKIGENPVQLGSTVDFGRTKLSTDLNLNPGVTPVTIGYILARKVELSDQVGEYKLKVSKQYASLSEQLNWQLQYPFTWDLVSQSRGVDTAKHQINIQTQLDTDETFDIIFKKR